WARNWLICSSTAASISAQVARGCALRHWVIPSTSRSPALTCCICSLRCRVFFLAFMLSSLSSFFPLVYHLPSPCKKMKRTPWSIRSIHLQLQMVYLRIPLLLDGHWHFRFDWRARWPKILLLQLVKCRLLRLNSHRAVNHGCDCM